MINLRKLVALDMLLHGTRFILIEFAVGVVLPLILGLSSIQSARAGPPAFGWVMLLGIWLVGIAANYVPPLIYALLIARAGSVKAEGEPELPQVRRYTIQQVIIFVPFLVVVVALVQESRRG